MTLWARGSRIVAGCMIGVMTCLAPLAATERGRIVYTQQDLELYIQKWLVRDGEAGRVISDYFCDFTVNNPRVFLELSSKKGIFDEWLRDLSKLSFVDYGGGCIDRECLRKLMIAALKQEAEGPGTSRARLIRRLEGIKVQSIN